MIGPELVARIRHLFFAEHWKVGTIAAELRLHRDTVRGALQSQRFSRTQAWGRRAKKRRFGTDLSLSQSQRAGRSATNSYNRSRARTTRL